MFGAAECRGELGSVVGNREKTVYPIIADPLAPFKCNDASGQALIKAPELITDANTLPAETDAEAIRDFFVEKIVHNCAHPTSPEAMCGHQYNRTLVGADTNSGVVLSLKPSAYADPREEKAAIAPPFDSTDMSAKDEAIESIKHTHIDSGVPEDFSSDRVFFFSHGNGILKIYNEPETPFGDSNDVYVGRGKRNHIPVISAITTDAEEQCQDQKWPYFGDASGVGEDISEKSLSGLGISNTALIEQVATFVATEAQACDDAHSYDSEGDVCDGNSPKSVDLTRSNFGSPYFRVFSDATRNKDAGSPLKMDLFRNLVQHKLVFSARKTTVNYYVPLVKSESLFRDIRALDRIHARETIKIAVLYVGPGQWSEAEILSNSLRDTSRSYRSFVDSLGWQVDLATFQGFTGKLEVDGSDGESCPYYANEDIEVAFHEAAAMPNDQKDIRQIKK
ncbi:hypothetical protein GGI20_003475, partial [Coemansia sp. BCRC 34301]